MTRPANCWCGPIYCGMSHFITRLLVLAFAATTAAVVFGCGRSDSGGLRTTPGAVTGSPTPAVNADWATPLTLPVTPVAPPEYTVADPAFEALPGARAIFGVDDTSNGAPHSYQIEVPDDWNGDVVYFAHGLRGNTNTLSVGPPPIRDFLIQHGYAWGASSYSQNGYRPGIGAQDTARLIPLFERLVGVPKHGYLYGQSMGGNVVTVSLESAETRAVYDGALSECGAMTGTGIVDYFLSWGALAGFLTDSNLPSSATDAGVFVLTLRDKVKPTLGSADQLSPKGLAFASAIEHLTGGPRPMFDEGFTANYDNNFLVLFGAIVAPAPSNAVAQNADTVYEVDDGLAVTTDDLNRGITRVQANPEFQDRERYPEFAPSTGDIAVPLLTIHGTGDLFVPIHLEQQYRRLVDAAGAGELLVQRAVQRPGHCIFTAEERQRAFTDLVAWVGSGTAPAGEDLLGDLTAAGRDFTSGG